MAIKTQTELVTQSDNTFLDNTTGQIIPTNHRLWNEDVLETMFEGIAGRVVTKSQFDTLVANSELVVGCVYKITDYPLPTGIDEIYVTAKTSSEIYGQAYCFVFDSYHLLIIDSDGSDAKVLLTLGKGVNASPGELYDYINGYVGGGLYEYGADFNVNTTAGVNNYFQFFGKLATTTANLLLNHNIYGSYETLASSSRFKGFLPEGVVNQRTYFYPDHGNQDTWGDYNIGSAGEFGQLEIIESSGYFTDIIDIIGNYQKVNNMVMGQVHFSCIYDVQPSAQNFDIPLPFQTTNIQSGILHGMATDASNSHTFYIRGQGITGLGATFRNLIDIIGNHSGSLQIFVDLTFSYELNY